VIFLIVRQKIMIEPGKPRCGLRWQTSACKERLAMQENSPSPPYPRLPSVELSKACERLVPARRPSHYHSRRCEFLFQILATSGGADLHSNYAAACVHDKASEQKPPWQLVALTAD
jgi:hypothetical protein